MSENLPPNPNVDTFNNSYWITSDTDELEKDIEILQQKTQNLSATSTTTTISSSSITNISGGLLNLTSTSNNLNITSNGNDINLNVPDGRAVYANSNLLFIGSGAPYNGFYSNIRMRNDTNTDWETQSRAFTETLRTQILTNQTNTQKLTANATSTTLSSANTTIQGSTQLIMSGNTILILGSLMNITTSLDDLTLTSPTNKSVIANTNSLFVGSTSTPNGNGSYSNIFMRNPSNTAWETQSRAFTETLRNSVLQSATEISNLYSLFQNQIIKINTTTAIGNTDILGRNPNTLTPSTNYPSTTKNLNLGILMFNSGYTTYFNSLGRWIYNGGAPQRVSIKYDINFLGLSTGIKAMVSRILINTSGGTAVEQSMPMGVRYNQAGGNPLNTNLYYSTGPFITDLQNGYTITLETENFFSTSTDGASVTTNGRLTFYLLPY